MGSPSLRLTSTKSSLKALFSNLILVGDFNVNFLSTTNSPHYSHLTHILSAFSLTQIVDEPTHHDPNGASSLIDLALLSSPQLLRDCSIVPPLINSTATKRFHLGIHFELNCRSDPPPGRKRRAVWQYHLADFDRASQLLSQLDLDNLFCDADIDTCWDRWKTSFLDIMDSCIPKSTLPDKRSVPWLTKEVVQAIRKRDYYFKKAKRTGDISARDRYNQLRNSIVSQLRQLKKDFFRKFENGSDSEFWKAARLLDDRRTSFLNLADGSDIVTSDVTKAELLNNHFANSFNKEVPPIDESPSPLSTSRNSELDDLLCSEEEVFCLLSNIDSTKSCGPDLISGKMLKSTASAITPAVTLLFNKSLTLGKVPRDWKIARVTPIPKSSKKVDPSNFRPVSLLSILSKILERHLHHYLLDDLEHRDVLSDHQWGYLKGRSTTGALISAVDSWHKTLENRSDICAVFLDLSKAFDKVPHRLLMDKLAALNINAYLLQWLWDYLSNRSQYVAVNGTASHLTRVTSGVPQGSVLGPLLFLIYINDITDNHSLNCSLSLYADDILLYRTINSQRDFTLLQQDINALQRWCNQNIMKFNVSKCKYMIISRKLSPLQPQAPLVIETTPLVRVSEFKYLGVWLSEKLDWSYHIQAITKTAVKTVGMLYRRFYKFASTQTLVKMYTTVVRPLLEYAAPVWDPHQQSLKAALERVQKLAIRMCAKDWSASYYDLLSDFNLPTLNERRKLLKLSFFYQIQNGHFHCPSSSVHLNPMDLRLRNHDSTRLAIGGPAPHTCSYDASFYPDAVRLWNELPSEVRLVGSVSSFKKAVINYWNDCY